MEQYLSTQHQPHSAVRSMASVRGGIADHMSCSSCEHIVGLAINLTATSAGRDLVIAIVDSVCKKELPHANETKLQALCEDLGKDLVDVIPDINKGLESLAWDVPKGFCSVFIPVCKQPCCSADAPTTPQQRHLSLTGNSTTMAVTWVTLNSTTTSTVQWGPASDVAMTGSLPFSSNGAAHTRTYTNGGWIGVIHTAIMTHLKPGTAYTYRVGDASGGWSSQTTFNTLPSNIGTTERPLRLAQIGDTGWGPESNETIATLTGMAERGEIDVMLHVGDIGYADGYESHWDIFMRKVEGISSRVPYMTAPGNHELWFNFTAYKARFWMPLPNAGEKRPVAYDTPMYYSVDIGPLHLVMYNTETWYDTANIDAQQLAWLKEDLAAASQNKKERPWIVTAGHRPLYCSNGGVQCGLFADWLRFLAEDTFYSSKVDVVIQCHEHDMERSFPIYKGAVTQNNYTDPAAPVYVVNGAGGNREGNVNPKQEDWVGFHSADRGFARITIHGSSQLDWQFVASNGTVVDAFNVTRSS